ncbi:MAG TPA: HNH endonuclease signature motif containing protein [Pirellulales bacterium]|nr:HNH endonuclease signature motif containing protein [Pirellulales bacterium]
MNFIVQRYGSGHRSLAALVNLFQYLFDGAVKGQQREDLLPTLLTDEKLKFLETKLDSKGVAKDFKTDRKSAVYLREALEKALRCKICGARIHVQSITVDHKTKRQEGGVASVDNAQLAHPFCNSARDSLKIKSQ